LEDWGDQMSAGELVRRIAIWSLVPAFVAVSIWLAVVWSDGQIEAMTMFGFTTFPIVGAIILTNRPRNGVGWYLWGVGAIVLVIMWGLAPDLYRSVPPWIESVGTAVASAFWVSLPLIGALYPTGRLDTRLGRVGFWTIAGSAIAFVPYYLVMPGAMTTSGRENPFALPLSDSFIAVVDVASPILVIGGIVMIVVDLILRWRATGSVGRLQYRWFVFSLLLAIGVVAVAFAVFRFAPGSIWDSTMLVICLLAFNAIPVSIGVAITRHGLYSIGRVISRTVSYAIVALLAIGVYAGIVTSITLLLPGLPSVGVALATLAAAAIFLPLLRVVQRWLDRRFDRERYNAEHVVEAFGEHLRVDADPSRASGELVDAVEKSLQPTSVGVWTAAR
jgi:hypothetical protein